jgi:hypothetical protein
MKVVEIIMKMLMVMTVARRVGWSAAILLLATKHWTDLVGCVADALSW